MHVNDFFKGVSDAFAANRSNAGLIFAIVIFVILAIFVYFKYFTRPKPAAVHEPKKSTKYAHQKAGAVNRLIEAIFAGDASQEAVALKNLTNHYIDNYIENSLDALTINALNAKYWDIVTYIINKKFRNEGDNLFELTFSEDEKKIIDFAYLSDRLVLSSSGFDDSMLNDALGSESYIKDYDFKIHTITSWLSASLKEFTSANALERLNAEYESINSKLSMANMEKEISFKTRKLLIYEIAKQNAGKPLVKAMMATSEKIERIIDAYSFYKYKTGSGFSMTKEELLEFVNIENFLINSLRNERREELKNIAYGERYNTELISLETELINKECELLKLVSLKARCLAEIEKYDLCRKRASAQSNIDFLVSKIEYIKNILNQVAKRNEIEPILFMTKKIYKKIPDMVFQVIAKFLEADPQVFKSKISKNSGIPEILFVPGCGNGIYNVETNTLILPEFPIKDYNVLVITALALYRWECDDEGNLKRSFNSLKCNKKLTFAALQQLFVKCYVNFITKDKESVGLEKDILDWFKFEISPKKGEEIRAEIKSKAALKQTEEALPQEGSGAKEEPPVQVQDLPENKTADSAVRQAVAIPASAEDKSPGETGALIESAAVREEIKQPQISEEQLKRELVYDKIKLLFKNNELDENKIAVNFIDEEHNFNIEFKNISVKNFDEVFKTIYENPKLKDLLTGIYKKS